jgi:hypothetical protein
MEVFGAAAVLEQACDDSGLCALVGNPQSCCTLSTFFSTQHIICSATDFDSSLDEQDFKDCDRACDLTTGGWVSLV